MGEVLAQGGAAGGVDDEAPQMYLFSSPVGVEANLGETVVAVAGGRDVEVAQLGAVGGKVDAISLFHSAMQRVLVEGDAYRRVVGHHRCVERHGCHGSVGQHKVLIVNVECCGRGWLWRVLRLGCRCLGERQAPLVDAHKVVDFSHLRVEADLLQAFVDDVAGFGGEAHGGFEEGTVGQLAGCLRVAIVRRH